MIVLILPYGEWIMFNNFLTWVGYNSKLHYKNRIAYVTNSVSLVLAMLFLGFYIFLIKFYPPVPGTIAYLISVVVVFILLKHHKFGAAKLLILIGFMLQESSIVFIWFPQDIHFSYYYFIIAPLTFFVYDYDIPREKALILIFNTLAAILLLISELSSYRPYAHQTSQEIIFLFKSISVFTVVFSIIFVFFIFSKELSKVHRELSWLANTDSLTKIYNRRILFELGKEHFNLSSKYDRHFSLILLDIDHFKQVNDNYGHPVGDDVLVKITELISGQIRKNDIFSRYGGEEFALILKDTNKTESIVIAEKLRKSIMDYDFDIDIDTREVLHITISAGVAQFNDKYETFGSMVQVADKALYKAKNSGRNKVVISED